MPGTVHSRKVNGPELSGSSTDSGAAIGWMYRSRALERRVNQLLVDSTILDVSGLEGSFDSALIDGSHQRAVVTNDIDKALTLLKPSGWLIFHDFSMDPRIVRSNSSTHGVLAAVADNAGVISERFDAFWVEGTLLLVCRPKPRSSEPGPGV